MCLPTVVHCTLARSLLRSAFDALVEARHLWKVETIGDSYIVAGGLFESALSPSRTLRRVSRNALRVGAVKAKRPSLLGSTETSGAPTIMPNMVERLPSGRASLTLPSALHPIASAAEVRARMDSVLGAAIEMQVVLLNGIPQALNASSATRTLLLVRAGDFEGVPCIYRPRHPDARRGAHRRCYPRRCRLRKPAFLCVTRGGADSASVRRVLCLGECEMSSSCCLPRLGHHHCLPVAVDARSPRCRSQAYSGRR